MAFHSLRRALFAAMLISVTVATSVLPHSKRRAPTTSVHPITLEELHFTCSVQGWTECHQMVSSLLDDSHNINEFLSGCHAEHDPYEQPSSPPTTPLTYSNVIGDSANVSEAQSSSGSGEHPSSEAPPEPATEAVTVSKEELKCAVSGAEKKRIRKNVYCGQLFDLDERLRSLVPSMCLLRDFGHCVPYYADPGYLTPNQVMESIKLWHQDMINTHKRCCESRDSNQNSSRIFSRDLSALYGSRIDFRIGEMLNMCPFSHAGSLWDGGLSKVALLVHMLELMQGLGRRRTCLRGCVSEGQVVCTDLLPYVL